MLLTSAGVEPATSWSPVGRASNWPTEAGPANLLKRTLSASNSHMHYTVSDLSLHCFLWHVYMYCSNINSYYSTLKFEEHILFFKRMIKVLCKEVLQSHKNCLFDGKRSKCTQSQFLLIHALKVVPMTRNALFQLMNPLLECVTVRWFRYTIKALVNGRSKHLSGLISQSSKTGFLSRKKEEVTWGKVWGIKGVW